MSDRNVEKLIETAHALYLCAASWEPDARLVGNVRAEDIARLCITIPELVSELAELQAAQVAGGEDEREYCKLVASIESGHDAQDDGYWAFADMLMRERAAARAPVEAKLTELQARYDALASAPASPFAYAIGQIESELGVRGAPPLSETVEAVRQLRAKVERVEALPVAWCKRSNGRHEAARGNADVEVGMDIADLRCGAELEAALRDEGES